MAQEGLIFFRGVLEPYGIMKARQHVLFCHRINETYALGLLLDGDTFDGIGIVNTSNRQLLPSCTFTQENGYFVFRSNGNTLMDCPVVVRLLYFSYKQQIHVDILQYSI